MRRSRCLSLAICLALVRAGSAPATDYWDASVINDNTAASTYNEMVHGVAQVHDLQANPGPVADQDWYYMFDAPGSSYEAVLDSASADVAPVSFDRLDGSGTTVVQTSEGMNVGAPVSGVRALRWENQTAGFVLNHIRILSGGCTTNCGPAAQYNVRFYDTTIAVPRFNNAGGQVTVLIVQNTTLWNRPIAGAAYFWNTAGVIVGSTTFSLPAHAALVLNTGTVPGVAGQGGTITISHDGGYGNLAVKAVALEPATGFSFDSPGVYKPL